MSKTELDELGYKIRTTIINGENYQIAEIDKSGVVTEIPGKLIGAELFRNNMPAELRIYDAMTRNGHGPLLRISCENGDKEAERFLPPWKFKRYEAGLAVRLVPQDARAVICYQPLDIAADIARIRAVLEKTAKPQWVNEYMFDLSISQTNKKVWFFPGLANYLYVKKCTGIVTLNFNSPGFEAWPLSENARLKFPYDKLFLTWTAQSRKELLIYVSNQEIDREGYRPFYINYDSPDNVNVGDTSTQIVPTNATRKYLCIVNNSDTTIYLAIGQDAEVNKGVRLNANGGSFEMIRDNLSYQVVNGIHGAGVVNKQVTIEEAS